jgi:hypothetical protein
MGGHSAWKKRVSNGELAKGYAGAICRHRPHLGRKGKDLIKNRKGYIGGGNPKKQKRATVLDDGCHDAHDDKGLQASSATMPFIACTTTWLLVFLSLLYLRYQGNTGSHYQ